MAEAEAAVRGDFVEHPSHATPVCCTRGSSLCVGRGQVRREPSSATMISATCPGTTPPPAGIDLPPTVRTLTLAGLLRPGDHRLARGATAARIEGQRDQPARGAGLSRAVCGTRQA